MKQKQTFCHGLQNHCRKEIVIDDISCPLNEGTRSFNKERYQTDLNCVGVICSKEVNKARIALKI